MYSRQNDLPRVAREDRYVRELCWWMKHAVGERDGPGFAQEASEKLGTPDSVRAIEPVLDVLAASNYELPVKDAQRIYQDRTAHTPKDPQLFIGKPCAVRTCDSMGVADISRYWSEDFTRGGLSLAAVYDETLFRHESGMQFCWEHIKEFIFPLIDRKHGVTTAQILTDFKDHDLWS